MNGLITGVLVFGVGYWIGRGSPRVTLGASWKPDAGNMLFTEDDPYPIVAVSDSMGDKRLVLRKGCRKIKGFECKRRA